MNWNEFAKEVHRVAVDHGWWDKPVSFADITVMCHLELSEAVEEYRAGRPMLWRRCTMSAGPCTGAVCNHWESGCQEGYLDDEPRGVAVELGDCILRILDYLAEAGVNIDGNLDFCVADKDLIGTVAKCHALISTAYIRRKYSCDNLLGCIEVILHWAAKNGVDLRTSCGPSMSTTRPEPTGTGGRKFSGGRKDVMAIKNYTSEVDAFKSLGEIQGALAKHGARQIMVEYDEQGLPAGITFTIETSQGRRGFLLPANIDGVMVAFREQGVRADRQQAMRTGWRNIRDWILAQMAIVEAGMVDVDEVFLPYLTDGRGNTVYSLYAGGQLALGGGM